MKILNASTGKVEFNEPVSDIILNLRNNLDTLVAYLQDEQHKQPGTVIEDMLPLNFSMVLPSEKGLLIINNKDGNINITVEIFEKGAKC